MVRFNPPFVTLLKRSFVFTFYFLLFALAVHAQGVPVSANGIDLSASPSNPNTGQQVTVTAVSYTIDINSANVVWYVNGDQIQKGVGKTTLVVTAPALGKTLNISVTAAAPGGQTVNGNLPITSGSIDFVIEPDGYAPPSFSGKLPVSYQNSVKIIAIPHLANASGVEYDPTSLVYTWKQSDGTVLTDQSGYGKQSVTIPGAVVPRPYAITLNVSTRDGSISTEGDVLVNPQAPSLNFYVNDPLYGPLYNTAVGNTVYIGSQKEVGVLAVPYGFDTPDGGTGLSFNWLVNGNQESSLDSSDSITLRSPAGQSGSSNIELDLSSANDTLQQVSNAFSAVFNANQSASSSPSATF